MLSKAKTGHAIVRNSDDGKFCVIAAAVAAGILVVAYATFVWSAPAPHDYPYTLVPPLELTGVP